MLTVIALLGLAGFAVYVMTPEERTRLLRSALMLAVRVRDAGDYGSKECRPFVQALQDRTPWPIVTPGLLAIYVILFISMLLGQGSLSDPEVLVAWGASRGPSTTSGEWWRLVTSLFVHGGVVHLLVGVLALASLGFIVERLVGPLTFALVYFASGVVAALADLALRPVAVSAGPSGAIFGLYGLLLASMVWGLRHRSPVTVPWPACVRLLPATALFVVFSIVSDRLHMGAELIGLAAGLTAGGVLAKGIWEAPPPLRRAAMTLTGTSVIVVALAVPLRGLVDVRPELKRIVAMEEQTSNQYAQSVARFRSGQITSGALADLIERQIVPELAAARDRLGALGKIPREHQPLVAGAGDYLRLREESWKLRSAALRKGSMAGLREADRAQQDALEAFERIGGGR